MTEPRLFVEAGLAVDAEVPLPGEQAHYLKNVLRLGAGASVKLFNGHDGEWRGAVAELGKNRGSVRLTEQLRPQLPEPDLWLLFAPIKGKRNEAIAEKAGELGVSVIQPVLTHRTVVSRVNVGRLQANALEAAEQCERLTVPEVREPVSLAKLLADWPADRRILFADERADARPIAKALTDAGSGQPWALLVGPEGGFAPEEQALVRALPHALPVSLGPRLLRADTACFAGLSIWQAHLGDWQHGDRGSAS